MKVLKQLCIWISVCGILSNTTLFAQENIGLKLGNYAGINGALLNPASTANYPLTWEFNIASAGAFLETNYAYFTRNENGNPISALQVIKNRENIKILGDNDQAFLPSDIIFQFRSYVVDTYRRLYLNTTVVGPSLLIRKNQHSFGIFTRARTIISGQRIDNDLAYPNFDRVAEGVDIISVPFKIGGMSWAEFGVHYGVSTDNTSIGINARYLQGYDAFFFNNNEEIEFQKLSNALSFPEGDFTYGFATNYDVETGEYNFQKNGMGGAFDIGFEYWAGGNDDKNYFFKIGASLLDVGLIRFNKNTQQHQLTEDNFDVIYDEFRNVNDEQEAVELLSQQVFGSNSTTYQKDKMSVWLPTSFSLQLDVQPIKNFYLNAIFMHRIRLEGPMIERQNSLSFSGRLETRWFELIMPMTIVNPLGEGGVGLACRVGPLTVGTDRLETFIAYDGSFLNNASIYASLKVRPTDLIGKNKRNYNANTKSSVECPKFQKKKKLF